MRLSILALSFTLALPVLAEESHLPAGTPVVAPEAASETPDQRPSRFHAALGPAWLHVLRENYVPAFTQNGFSTPARDRAGFDLLAYWTTDTRWQIGLGLTTVGFEQTLGSSSAEYSNGTFGVYFARNLSPSPDYDVTVGALLGMSDSQVTVFSAAKNGRYRETAGLAAPSVGVAWRVSQLVRLGLRASYLFPFSESSTARGQDLGVTRIAPQGFAVAFDVIFGR